MGRDMFRPLNAGTDGHGVDEPSELFKHPNGIVCLHLSQVLEKLLTHLPLEFLFLLALRLPKEW